METIMIVIGALIVLVFLTSCVLFWINPFNSFYRQVLNISTIVMLSFIFLLVVVLTIKGIIFEDITNVKPF